MNFNSRTIDIEYVNTKTVSLIVFGTLKFTIFKTIEGVKKFQQFSRQRLLFCLKFLKKVMPQVDILYSQLNMRCFDAIRTKTGVSNFMSAIIGVILFMTLKVMFMKISNECVHTEILMQKNCNLYSWWSTPSIWNLIPFGPARLLHSVGLDLDFTILLTKMNLRQQ